MPEGLLNYALGLLVLGLKLWLLPRAVAPAFAIYVTSTIGTSLFFLFGIHQAEPAGTSIAALSALLAAMECNILALGLSSPQEQYEVFWWCSLIGALLCAAAWIAGPDAYPGYSAAVYMARIYLGVFTIGWLVALLGYCFVTMDGIKFGIAHAGILLVRIAALTAILFVHSRELWYIADAIGGLINALTLGAWIWINPLQAYAGHAGRSPQSRRGSRASRVANQ